MRKLTATICLAVAVLFVAALVTANSTINAEPIYHEIKYPAGNGPFPVVIALHTSGGFKTVKKQISKYTNAGYAVYAPDFFRRHGISKSNRFETWTTYRAEIEVELLELIEVIKKDPKADAKNIFAVGFSNGGYWASFLAARKHVNAGASHYGVWRWPSSAGWNGYPADYFDADSNPVLAIHGHNDSIQKPRFVYDQLDVVEDKSSKFKKHIFRNAGHSWDCKPCRQDGYDEEATRQSLKVTLDFFEANKR
jgi:dienelactone hydrolase